MILPMARVELVGPRDLFRRALEFLQVHAVLQLRAPTVPVEPIRTPAEPGAATEAELEEALHRIDGLAARLPPARGEPAAPPSGPGASLSASLTALEGEVSALEARRSALVKEREQTRRFAQLVIALAPLGSDIDIAQGPEVHGLVLRNDPAALYLLEAEVRRITGGACEVKSRSLDAENAGVLIVVPRAHGDALTAALFEQGIDEVKLPPEYAGKRLADVLVILAARERALPCEIGRVDAELAALAAKARPSLAAWRRVAARAQERRQAVAACGETRFAFVVAGYMPAERVPALRRAAEAELGAQVAVFARPPGRAERAEVPVVLRNRRAVRPFGRLLALVRPPRYGSVDPTPWLAVFFPLFFGLVLGDVAFGVLGIAAALLVRRMGWGGAASRDIAAIVLWCSLSAIVFGLLFGEALGELGAHAGLRPLLLDRRSAFMPLLGVSLAIGWVHVAIGMVLGVVGAARAGRVREAIGRGAKLLMLATSACAACSLLGVLPRAALVPAAVGAAGSLAVAVGCEGPLAALDLVLGLGNVLSYARLMALGLASVMLAEVANRVATTLEPAVAGLALGVLLHALNFTVGLVSPAIAALRLHYVEFFEKFYDEGGFPFRPFGLSSR